MKKNDIEKELYIDSKIANKLKLSLKEHPHSEVGGILLGKANQDYSKIYITEIYEINGACNYEKISYVRDAEEAQTIIDRRWHETGGIINYVGEWHTHPNISPTPSHVDIRSMKKLYKKANAMLPIIFLIIIGERNQIHVTSIGGKCTCIHIQ